MSASPRATRAPRTQPSRSSCRSSAAAPGTLTVPAGSTSGTIAVPVVGDALNEADETFTVTLSALVNAALGTSVGTGTITNDDPLPSLSINDVRQAEGNSGTTNAVFT